MVLSVQILLLNLQIDSGSGYSADTGLCNGIKTGWFQKDAKLVFPQELRIAVSLVEILTPDPFWKEENVRNSQGSVVTTCTL